MMSNSADEIMIPPKTKRGRHDDESENEDRLSDLPDCVLLHILSFVHAKHAVRTCILSTRWKHLWKRIPTLTLHSSDFSTLKSFDKFMSMIFSLRDGSIALRSLDLKRHGIIERHNLRKVVNYVVSCSAQLQRLEISVKGDSCLILPCISSCRALTSLKLSIYAKGFYSGETLFPKSLNLPALTTLDLTNFAFCASDNADRAEPFWAFTRLNSLMLHSCTVRDAQILSISSATLVNLTMTYTYTYDFTKIELSAPRLCTFTFDGTPYQKLCGSSLSSVKQVNIHAYMFSPWGEPPLVLLNWLLDLPNIKSLTVTSSTLLVLALVPDLLKVKLPSLCNLKSLKVKFGPPQCKESIFLEAVMLKNKSRKEASKIKKAFKAGLEPSATIRDRIVGFLLQNSPSAKVDIQEFT